ncbi:hypothetical protein JB92DRAFT_3192490 [Gautieria morchelliformis]|nr:hypothetical protein JB92DRAFT_3192490 [Gautieria morchelliformis]
MWRKSSSLQRIMSSVSAAIPAKELEHVPVLAIARYIRSEFGSAHHHLSRLPPRSRCHSTMESRKRKREADAPRIKYHVEQRGKSFERILKENSLEELCEVVRKKISLDSKTKLELVQLRDGVIYDLEDDEDFEAFKSAAYAYSSLDVRVSFATDAAPQNASNARPGGSSLPGTSTSSSNIQGDGPKKTAHKSTANAGRSTQKGLVNGARFVAVINADGVHSLESDRANSVLSSANEEVAAPPKKRRKKAHPDSDAVATAGETKKKRAKGKESDVRAFNTVVPIGDADKGPVEKKRKRGQESDMGTSATPGDGTQVTTAEPSDTAKAKSKSKSKKKLSATTDTSTHGLESIIAQTLQAKAGKEQPTDGENRPSTSTSTKPVDAESPLTSSVPQAPHADPGTSSPNSIRRAYASVFSKLPRTASEIMANYSAASPSASSTSSEPRSEPVAKAAAPSKKTKTKVDAKEKGKGPSVVTKMKTKAKAKEKEKEKGKGADVATSGVVKDMPESGPAKNDQSDSRTAVDVEDEVHHAPSTKQTTVSDPPKEADVATLPRPRPSRVPRGIYAPPRKTGKQSTSPSQLHSPCPICLSSPFHLRFRCPVIMSGPDAIVERIAQLKAAGGRDDLVSDLEVWVERERKKAESKGATRTEKEATPKKVSPLPIAVGRSKPLDSPLPPWAAIQARPSSDVIVESTNEGSEQLFT